MQVVATRLHVASIIKGRSKCLSCGEALRAYDLIPFVSYLLLRGKCRYCKSSYGVESLIVELIYGVVFVFLYTKLFVVGVPLLHAALYFAYYSCLFGLLGVIALYDRRHTYIPTSFLFGFCGLTLVILAIRYMDDPTTMTLLAPLIVAFPFLVLWLLTKGKGVGFGDIVLFFGVGAFFGVEQGIAVLMVSIWIGAVAGSILYLIKRKQKDFTTQLPFVPFIVIAFLIVLFTDIDIISIANTFGKWYH